MKNNCILIAIVCVLVGGGGGFLAGMKYQQSKPPTFFRQFGGAADGQRGNFNGGNRQGFRPVAGTVIGSDANSITVKLNDGSSKIVLVSQTTTINKAEAGSIQDLTEGTMVAVFGQQNTDGTVTAQNIQLNPINREMTSNQPGQTNTTPTPTGNL